MSSSALNFDWNHTRAFLATARTGSLSKAAIELNLTQPTIGRQITALEESLSTLLFDRIGHRLILTPKGEELLRYVEMMESAAHRLSMSAQSYAESVEGHVSITASDNIAAVYLPKILKRARDVAPNITIEVHAVNAVEDLTRREADIALRHVEPTQNDLIAKKIGTMTARLYASKDYLDSLTRFDSLDDLRDAKLVGMDKPSVVERHMQALNMPFGEDNVLYSSESGLVAWEMAKAGLGMTFMADEIASLTPGMVAVCAEESALTFPIWLVTHQELHTNKRIRIIFDLIAESFANTQELLGEKS